MKQKMKKLIFLMIRLVCGVLFHTNHRTYMKLYVPLLRWMGVHVTGEPRYIGFHVKFDDYSRIALGDRTTISDGCILLTHDYSFTTALIAGGRKPRTAVMRSVKKCFATILQNSGMDAWRQALLRGRIAVEKTSELLPKVGRARPQGKRSLGTPDAGAVSLIFCLEAAGNVCLK